MVLLVCCREVSFALLPASDGTVCSDDIAGSTYGHFNLEPVVVPAAGRVGDAEDRAGHYLLRGPCQEENGVGKPSDLCA